MAAKAKKVSKKSKAVPAKQEQAAFPTKGTPGQCRVCGVEVGPKATLCSTHRALLARKRDRALFLHIKSTDAGKDLIKKAVSKGVLAHLGL